MTDPDDGEELQISMIGRLKITQVANDQIRYRQFAEVGVVRGACR